MPIVWASKMQTECALSSTDSKYVSLLTSSRDAITMIAILQERTDVGFKNNNDNTIIFIRPMKTMKVRLRWQDCQNSDHQILNTSILNIIIFMITLKMETSKWRM
jgi:hypothetical protein